MKKVFRKSVAVLLALCMALSLAIPGFAADDDNKCGDDLTWSYSGGVLTITGSGPMYEYNAGGTPWYSYLNSLTTVIVDGATTLSYDIFGGFQQITSVSLSDSVETIEGWVFATCRGLPEITLPEKLSFIDEYAFGNCTNLKKIVFTGNAPTFNKNDIFSSVTATAYYPAENETWTQSVMQNYGGSITWVAYTEADKEALESLIAQAQALDGDAYTTSSWNALQTALSDAEEIDQDIIASQDDVNAAASALSNAIANLVAAANKTALKELIDQADALHETAYTAESWDVLQQALAEARSVYSNGDADQDTVDAAAKTLQDAIDGLESLLLGSGQCGDNLTWELDRYGNLIISGTGAMYDYGLEDNQAPWTGMEVTELTIEEGATSIGTYAFAGLTTLLYADITDTVMSVGDHAFDGDTALAYIVFSGDNGTAPTFGESSFSDVTAVVYHPDNNAWQEVLDEDYGGTLTWVEYEVGFHTESFSFEWDPPAGGAARFNVCLFDQDGNAITGSRTSSSFGNNKYDDGDQTSYTFTIEDFVDTYVVLSEEGYTFSYATVSDPNITDTAHDPYEGMLAQYGSSIDPVVKMKINWTNPNNYTSKTWNYTMYCQDGPEYTVSQYGNQNGANDSSGRWCPYFLELNLYFEQEVDKTALEAAIEEANALKEEEYTPASWAVFDAALKAAVAVDEDEDASQTEVDDATDALTEAMNALVAVPDKTDLEAAIVVADTLNQEDYTPSSWVDFATALQTAKTVDGDVNASQTDVDEALQALNDAMGALEEAVDKTALEEAIEKASTLDEDDYTPDSWAAFEEVLHRAENIDKDDHVSQDDVDNATKDLTEAMDDLVEAANKTALEEAIAAVDELDEEAYTPDSWSVLEEALETAKTVDQDPNASQDDVDKALQDLTEAMGALVKVADKSALEEAISTAKDLNEDAYTSSSWAALKDALEAAETVDEDKNASQDEVNEATEKLTDAIGALVEAAEKTALGDAIAKAEDLDSTKYTTTSWNNLQEALEAAEKVYSDGDATQQDVADALSALETAVSELVAAADKTALEAAIAEAEDLDSTKYTTTSWNNLLTVLAQAEEVYNNGDATDEQVAAAVSALQAAISDLKETADKSNLEAAIEEAKALDEKQYTEESWAVLKEALDAAEKVYGDDDADQNTVDSAEAVLRAAISSLVTHTHEFEAVVTDPTCTTAGYTTYTCTICGESYKDDYKDALGHDYVGTVTEPTCTDAGYTTYTCSVCGDSYVGDYTDAYGHAWDEGNVTTEPTCTEDGVMTYTCGRCDATRTDVISNLGHDYAVSGVTAPTCTEDGYTTYTCSRCNATYISDETDALGHAWDEGVVTTEPTCQTEGVMTYTCTRCNETRTESIVKADHHYVAGDPTPATCTEAGYTTYTCSYCGDSYETDLTSALGHAWDEGKVTTEPTCTEEGVMTYTCERCDATRTDVIANLGHDYTATEVTDPTCTEDGYTTYTCSRCDATYISDETDALGHAWDEGVVTTAPTCQTEGVMTYTCTRCNETKTESIVKADHHYVAGDPTPATCTEAGYTTYTCSYCGDSYESDLTNALGHAWNDGEVTTPATCTEEGVMTYTCTRCSETRTDVIANLGHDYTVTGVTAPTCTEDGYTTYTCSRCNATYNSDETDALGHAWNDGEVTTAPTCQTEGVMTYTCTRCDATRTESIVKADHNYVAGEPTPATCTDAGYTTYTCTVCGDSYESDLTNALGHAWDEGVVTTPATCTEEGVMTYTCERCDATRTDVISNLGHDYTATEVTDPTCTEDGYTTYTCSRCDATYISDETDALGHAWDEGVVTTSPTCQTEGVMTYTCTRCNATRTEAIARTAHDYVGVVTEPTCTDAGYTTYTCSVCGDSYVSDYTNAHGHQWNDGEVTKEPTATESGELTYTCTVCGATYTETIPPTGSELYTGFASMEGDGNWYYYIDGEIARGLNTVMEGTVNGADGWWYVVNGQVQLHYTGVCDYCNDYGWWYVKSGKVDFSCNSVEQNEYGWWYILGGKVDFSYTGVSNYSNAYGWWYIENGKVNFSKTGIEPNDYGWWRVVDGKVDFSCNSVEQNDYGWWYVVGGKVDFSYTGVANYANDYGWWYIENGKVNFHKTGIEQNQYGWWRVVDGKVDFSCNSVEQNEYGWWYVVGGKVDFSYTGVANYANAYGWWYIKEGKVDFSYTGTASNNYGTWNVVNGKVDFSRS